MHRRLTSIRNRRPARLPVVRRRCGLPLAVERLEGRALMTIDYRFALGVGSASSSDVTPHGVATDPSGNTYVIGEFTGSVDLDPTGTNPAGNLTSSGNRDVFVAKYSTTGALVYAHGLGGIGDEIGWGIAVDNAGDAFLSGTYSGNSFGTAWGGFGAFVVKLNPAGAAVWTSVAGSTTANSDVEGMGIAVDAAGANVYVTGIYTNTAQFGGNSVTGNSTGNAYVTKLSGSTGAFQWVQGTNGASSTSALGQSIAIDGAGNGIATGFLQGGTVSFGATNLTSSSNDIFVWKLLGTGVQSYAKQFGSTGYDTGAGIVADASNNVYLTGQFQGTVAFGPFSITAGSGLFGQYAAKLDPNGSPLWAVALANSNQPHFKFPSATGLGGIALDAAGTVDVTGPFQGTATFPGGLSVTSAGGTDVFVVKLNVSTGVAADAGRAGGTGEDLSNGISSPSAGVDSIVGTYTGSPTFGSRPALPNLGSQNMFVAQAGPLGIGSARADYDGDGKTDIAVFDPKSNTYYIIRSSNGTAYFTSFGPPNVVPVVGDFDGDGKTDIAVFDPKTSTFYIIRSSNGSAYSISFGPPGSIPVSGDFDGDGKTDIAVFDPKSDTYYIIRSSNGSAYTVSFGPPNVIPVAGDYDGDGKTDIAVFDPKSNTYYVIRSSNGSAYFTSFGPPNVLPVPGDYDGDGKTDIAVFDPKSNTYYVIRSSNGSAFFTSFGPPNVVPLQGDFDGDHKTDIAVFDPASNTYYVVRSSNGTAYFTSFGPPNVVPLATTDAELYTLATGTAIVTSGLSRAAALHAIAAPGTSTQALAAPSAATIVVAPLTTADISGGPIIPLVTSPTKKSKDNLLLAALDQLLTP